MIDKSKQDGKVVWCLNVLVLVSIIVGYYSYQRDFFYTINYGGVDLRNRVVGARVLQQGLDPYYYKWKPGDSELLLDPSDQPNSPVTRLTASPTVLMFHLPLANLHYSIQQKIWLGVQWAFLLLTIGFLSLSAASKTKSRMIWILGLLVVSASPIWSLHVERGQAYILYACLLALALWLLPRNPLVSGIVAGFTVCLRPLVGLILIPMLIHRKWKFLSGAAVGLVLGLALPLFNAKPSIWASYVSVMMFHTGVHKNPMPFDKMAPSKIKIKSVEGMKNLKKMAKIRFSNSSLQQTMRTFGVNLSSKLLVLAFAAILVLVSAYLYTSRGLGMEKLFFIGAVLVFLSEFFIPAARYSYNNVIWLVMFALILIHSETRFFPASPWLAFLLAGLIFTFAFKLIKSSLLWADYSILVYALLTFGSLLRAWKSGPDYSAPGTERRPQSQ